MPLLLRHKHSRRAMARMLQTSILILLVLSVAYILPVASASSLMSIRTYLMPVEGTSRNQDNVTFFSREIIVLSNRNSLLDELLLISSIPLSIFHDPATNKTYISPIIMYYGGIPEQYLLDDWVSTCSQEGVSRRTIVLTLSGKSPPTSLNKYLSNSLTSILRESDLQNMSALLATYDWFSSEYVVLAPAPLKEQTLQEVTITNVCKIALKNMLRRTKLINYPPGAFEIDSNVSWIEGSLTKDIGFVISDPNGIEISYALVPNSSFMFPSTVPGTYKFEVLEGYTYSDNNIIITLYPGIREEILVDNSTLWLNVTLEWTDERIDLDLFLISPNGLLSGISANDTGTFEHIEIYKPIPGTWTALIGSKNNITSLPCYINISLAKRNDTIALKWLLNSANAAILSSFLNAPLMYVLCNDIPESVIDAMNKLHTKRVVLMDIYNICSTSLVEKIHNAIPNAQVTIIKSVSTYLNYLLNLTTPEAMILVAPEPICIPAAAILGAYHRAPIIAVNRTFLDWIHAAWATFRLQTSPDGYEGYIDSTHTYDYLVPHYYLMKRLAQEFNKTISRLMSQKPKSIVIIAPLETVEPSIDRSILGTFPVGRISGYTCEELVAFVMREALYPALASGNKNKDKALLSFLAYLENGTFADEKISEFKDVNVTIVNGGFTPLYQIGYTEVIYRANEGPTLWIISTHGGAFGVRPNAEGVLLFYFENKSYYSDGVNGIVNPPPENCRIVSAEYLDAYLENLHGTVILILACTVGASNLPYTLFKHGASLVIAPLRTVGFEPAAWLDVKMNHHITQRARVGEALSALTRIAGPIYLEETYGYDYSFSFVLFGDPLLQVYTPNTPKPELVQPKFISVGGHLPDYKLTTYAALYSEKCGYLIKLLEEINKTLQISFSEYSIEHELSSLMENLQIHRVIIVESGIVNTFDENLRQYADKLEEFVRMGGILIILGAYNTNIDWLPLQVTAKPTNGIANYADLLSEHPIFSYPNNITEVPYYGCFANYHHNLSVLAYDKSGRPIILAGRYFLGKMLFMAASPDRDNMTLFMENILMWAFLQPLKIKNIEVISIPVIRGGVAKIKVEVLASESSICENATVLAWTGDFRERTTATLHENDTYIVSIRVSEIPRDGLPITIMAAAEGYDASFTIIYVKLPKEAKTLSLIAFLGSLLASMAAVMLIPPRITRREAYSSPEA